MLWHLREGKRIQFSAFGGEDGTWCEDKDSIVAMTVSYFEKIYTTSSPSGINEFTNTIPRRVIKEMNVELSRNFTREEILKALD